MTDKNYFSKDKISWKDQVVTEFEDLEEYFPKGDKRRGDAMVVNAGAYLEGKKEGRNDKEKQIFEKLDKRFSETNEIDKAEWEELKQEIEK